MGVGSGSGVGNSEAVAVAGDDEGTDVGGTDAEGDVVGMSPNPRLPAMKTVPPSTTMIERLATSSERIAGARRLPRRAAPTTTSRTLLGVPMSEGRLRTVAVARMAAA
jgi:hypothetical protein